MRRKPYLFLYHNWLSRVQELRRDSERSNAQLSAARETNRKLEQSFNEYEAGQLIMISSKNGEIADLKQEAAGQRLEKEKYKGSARARLTVIIALLAAIAGYAAFKACRFFKII